MLLLLLIASPLHAQTQTRARRVEQTAQPETTSPPISPPSSTDLPQTPDNSSTVEPDEGLSLPPAATATSSDTVKEEVGEDEVVRVNTTLVTVPVSVMDRHGKFVSGLRQSDFRIYEEGELQEVAYFAPVEKPFTVALLLDTSRSTRFRLEDIQAAAIAFVDQLRPDDRVMIIAFDSVVQVLSEATNNRQALYQAIRRTRTGGGTRLYDAVDMVLNHRFNNVTGRKAIVLFTDGVDTASTQANYGSNVLGAEESEVLVYTVQYDTYDVIRQDNPKVWSSTLLRPNVNTRTSSSSPPGSRNRTVSRSASTNRTGTRINITQPAQPDLGQIEFARAERYLRELATRTGARWYRANDLANLQQSFASIAEELRRQYSLGYYPKSPAQAGERRQIKVMVVTHNMAVRARDSYVYNPSANRR